MAILIKKPVFFIGMPRSGTTVVFETFSTHEQLGWISNYSARFPYWPITNVIRLLLDNQLWSIRGRRQQYGRRSLLRSILPKPQEAYPFWQAYCGPDFLWEFHLRQQTLRQNELNRLREVLQKTLTYQDKTRLAAKLTGPPRIGYLTALFPDAIFIHIIRDGRAVVDSLLRVDFWRDKGGLQRPFWRGALTENDLEDWERLGRGPVALASLEWKNVIKCTRQEAVSLEPGRYMELTYETFVADPGGSLGHLYESCGLGLSEKTRGYLRAMPKLQNMNNKYLERPAAEIDEMNKIMGNMLLELGY